MDPSNIDLGSIDLQKTGFTNFVHSESHNFFQDRSFNQSIDRIRTTELFLKPTTMNFKLSTVAFIAAVKTATAMASDSSSAVVANSAMERLLKTVDDMNAQQTGEYYGDVSFKACLSYNVNSTRLDSTRLDSINCMNIF